MGTVLVQLSDSNWTCRAVVDASVRARESGDSITLLRLAPAKNPSLIGWEIDSASVKDVALIEQCAALASAQNVTCSTLSIEYFDAVDAIAQAADYLHASCCYVRPPFAWMPPLRTMWIWVLRQKLHECALVVPTRTRDATHSRRLAWQRR